MDDELWAQVDNKRNLMKMVNRGEESFARDRIKKLRQIIAEEKGDTTTADEATLVRQQLNALKAELELARSQLDASEPPTPPDDLLQVVCPADLSPDRKLRIALPDGREFDVTVPDDVGDGEPFLVGPFPV